MKIKTTKLTGRALDWAVGVAVGERIEIRDCRPYVDKAIGEGIRYWYEPTTNWGQLGPYTSLINIVVRHNSQDLVLVELWQESKGHGEARAHEFEIALCRAIVDLYLGDQVDVPEVLL